MKGEAMKKERGKAGITITLEDSIIKVCHNDDGRVLKKFTAREGDWKKLWATLNLIEASTLHATTFGKEM